LAYAGGLAGLLLCALLLILSGIPAPAAAAGSTICVGLAGDYATLQAAVAEGLNLYGAAAAVLLDYSVQYGNEHDIGPEAEADGSITTAHTVAAVRHRRRAATVRTAGRHRGI
jgi:hypothetical protein